MEGPLQSMENIHRLKIFLECSYLLLLYVITAILLA